MNEIRNAPKIAWKNRKLLEQSKTCACYHCLQIFETSKIQEWTDNKDTAICPNCHVDAILDENCGIYFNHETLQKVHDFWFQPRNCC